MPLPVEALAPFAIITGIFFAMRHGVAAWQKFENDGKPKRYNVDRWDRRMMERDSRLTGNVNIQSFETEASPEFSTSSMLELEKPSIDLTKDPAFIKLSR